MIHYRQCMLFQQGGDGKYTGLHQTAWLPETFARVGAVLRIAAEEGWVVVAVYLQRIPDVYLKEYASRDYRTQRAASDI